MYQAPRTSDNSRADGVSMEALNRRERLPLRVLGMSLVRNVWSRNVMRCRDVRGRSTTVVLCAKLECPTGWLYDTIPGSHISLRVSVRLTTVLAWRSPLINCATSFDAPAPMP